MDRFMGLPEHTGIGDSPVYLQGRGARHAGHASHTLCSSWEP